MREADRLIEITEAKERVRAVADDVEPALREPAGTGCAGPNVRLRFNTRQAVFTDTPYAGRPTRMGLHLVRLSLLGGWFRPRVWLVGGSRTRSGANHEIGNELADRGTTVAAMFRVAYANPLTPLWADARTARP
jgi:hypothetical protein